MVCLEGGGGDQGAGEAWGVCEFQQEVEECLRGAQVVD